jgi:pimeloyl-ACP methyl ester carboxylesterase
MRTTPADLLLPAGRMHLEQIGKPEGSPVVCVPGLSSNLRAFDAIAPKLARSKHRVASLDLRGRGLSPATAPGTYGWRRHAEDVLQAAERLGFQNFDLIGHSMGAFVAMEAANLAPQRVRRLVLIDGVGIPDRSVIPPILASVQRLGVSYPSAEAYLDQIHRNGAAVPWDELWKGHALYELETVPGGVHPRTSKAAVLEDAAYGGTHDAAMFWRGLTMPTLLVRATQPLPPSTGFVVGEKLRDEFLAKVRGARSVEVDANHYGVMAHPTALRAITEFLAGREA